MPEETTGTTTSAPPTVMDRVISDGRIVRDDSQRPYAITLISEYATQVLDEGMTVNKNSTVAGIKQRIAEIDQTVSDQLNAIMHSPEFQKLEAAWRGLHYLVMNTETGTMLKLRLLNATKKELLADLEKATEFDQSALFKKVYEEEYGTFGGNPYSVLVGDYEFGRSPQDIKMLEEISHVAAAAHAPFLTAASPALFDWDDFTQMAVPRDL